MDCGCYTTDMKQMVTGREERTILEQSPATLRSTIRILTISAASYFVTCIVVVSSVSFSNNTFLPNSIDWERARDLQILGATAITAQVMLLGWLLSFVWRQKLIIKYGSRSNGRKYWITRDIVWVSCALIVPALLSTLFFAFVEPGSPTNNFYRSITFVGILEFVVLVVTRWIVMMWESKVP